jgi:hypothetical protein
MRFGGHWLSDSYGTTLECRCGWVSSASCTNYECAGADFDEHLREYEPDVEQYEGEI